MPGIQAAIVHDLCGLAPTATLQGSSTDDPGMFEQHWMVTPQRLPLRSTPIPTAQATRR